MAWKGGTQEILPTGMEEFQGFNTWDGHTRCILSDYALELMNP